MGMRGARGKALRARLSGFLPAAPGGCCEIRQVQAARTTRGPLRHLGRLQRTDSRGSAAEVSGLPTDQRVARRRSLSESRTLLAYVRRFVLIRGEKREESDFLTGGSRG